MEMTVNQRIGFFLKEKNIPQTEIATKLSVTKQTVSNWINGTVQIPLKHLISLISEYDYLNVRWLLTGEGTLETGQAPADTPEEKKKEGAIELLKEQLATREKMIATLNKEIGRLEEQLSSRKK